MSLFLSVVQAIKSRILHPNNTSKPNTHRNENNLSEFQLKLSSQGVSPSAWQFLIEDVDATNSEPSAEEFDAQLKTVFRERMLAASPEFASYFKSDITGSALEERLLDKAKAAAREEAGQEAAANLPRRYLSQSQRAARWRPSGRGPHWLRRYRCWPPRVRVYLTLTHPEYTRLAFWINVFLMAVIVLNTVTFCMESVPHWEESNVYDKLVIVDYACLGIFTVEFLLRLATCSSFRRFAVTPLNWVDIITILPFYMELIVLGPGSHEAAQTRVVRLLRLLRIMRILRSTKKFRNLQIVVDALVNSLDVIAMLGMLLVVLLVVSGTIVYYVEGALIPDTWFDSIPLTIYYMHTTLTTTGYGDYYAQSSWGRFVVGLFMLLCIVTLSLPIGVVGGNFSGLWSRYTAIRDSLERSAEAWGTRERLRQLSARNCEALDDLIGRVNRLKSGLEDGDEGVEGVKALHDRLGELKEGLKEQREAARRTPCYAACQSLDALRADVAELSQRMDEADRRYSDVQVLLAVSYRLVSPDLSEQLDKLHNVNRDVAGWVGDDAGGAMAARELLAELKAISHVVKVEDEIAKNNGGGAAAATGMGVSGDGQTGLRGSGKGNGAGEYGEGDVGTISGNELKAV